jgi:amino-acid N-acetyltransferase
MKPIDAIMLTPATQSLPTIQVASDTPICIRGGRAADVAPIQRLVNYYAAQEVMLPKSEAQIYNSLQSFAVAEADGQLVGCAALKLTWANPAEIVSLAVRPELHGRQVGSQLVMSLLDQARALGVPVVFALTLRPTFFERLGFRRVPKSTLPHKIWNDCSNCPKQNRCDEIAVLREV